NASTRSRFSTSSSTFCSSSLTQWRLCGTHNRFIEIDKYISNNRFHCSGCNALRLHECVSLFSYVTPK
ncbi:hypothetical protein PMAYCL1PPCAC_16312, partial [Pristionchus mayeri]